MKIIKLLVFVAMTMAGFVAVNAIDVPREKQIINGGFAFANFSNGAAFTWDTYVAPVIKINTNGTTTTINTTPGYFKNLPSSNQSKYVFNSNLGLGSVRQPDLNELVKVLISENILPVGTTKTVYDIQTRDAVANLQRKYGIKPAPQYPYGFFGPLTRSYLNNR